MLNARARKPLSSILAISAFALIATPAIADYRFTTGQDENLDLPRFKVSASGIYSRIEDPNKLGFGTFQNATGDFGLALGAEYINRYGGSIQGYTGILLPDIMLDLFAFLYCLPPEEYSASGFMSFHGLHSGGDYNTYGQATVGVNGTNFVGLTYNQNIGVSTGIGSGFAGDYVIANGELNNTWSFGEVGFGMNFKPNDDSKPSVAMQIIPFFEQFKSDSNADAYIGRAGARLAEQQTRTDTEDNFFGLGFEAKAVKEFGPNNNAYVSAGARANVSFRDSSASFWQNNNGTIQAFDYDDSGIELGGTLEFGVGYKFQNDWSITGEFGVSVLPGVTGFDSRETPNDQVGHFESKNVTRYDFTMKISRTF